MDGSNSYVSGYDLPVYGLGSDKFYQLHIPALACIILSLVSASYVICDSFRIKGFKTFFKCTKSERFVVYLALCDLLFNIAHTMDHAHILATKNHVYPLSLCEFYGFMLAEFITAQNLMVNIVAINAFVLIYFDKHLNFGRQDWKLLTWTFGAPFVGASIAGIAGQLGPNGAFCYFDGVKGKMTNIFFTTVPLLLVLAINSVLYTLTWCRIYNEGKRLKEAIGDKATSIRAAHRAARTMSLFVTMFFIQWWAMAIYGIWQLVSEVPHVLFQFVTSFSNIGGILNGIVYVIIKRRQIQGKVGDRTTAGDGAGKANEEVTKTEQV